MLWKSIFDTHLICLSFYALTQHQILHVKRLHNVGKTLPSNGGPASV